MTGQIQYCINTMSLQHLRISAIAEADLIRLAVEGIPESKTLEYKEVLLYATDEQKREFLGDVTALANSDGGDIVFGMKAEKGAAKELVGLANLIPDDALGKIENLLRDFVQPRILGVEIRAITVNANNHALLVRAPRSFAAPHMVRHQGVTRFCGRNSNGKYDLDVHELRSAFVANESYADRLKSFRLDRINRLITGSPTVAIKGQHYLVLHLLPVVGARPDTQIATLDFERIMGTNILRPISSGGWGPVFNFDGLLVAAHGNDNRLYSYVQVMRNGFLEAVDALILAQRTCNDKEPSKIIPSIAWEQKLLEALPGYLKALDQLSLPPPYVLSLSLLNVKGFSMYVGPRYGDGMRPIDREHLLTEEILIESVTGTPEAILRPLFDQIWNACGWRGSINYDEAGNWRAHG